MIELLLLTVPLLFIEHDIAIEEDNKKLLQRSSHDTHTRSRRAATANSTYLWPNGVVPYAIDSIYTRKFFDSSRTLVCMDFPLRQNSI